MLRLLAVLLGHSFYLISRSFNNEELWSTEPEIPLKTNMALAHLECEGQDGANSSDWLYVYPMVPRGSFVCARWHCTLEKNGELRGTVWLCQANSRVLCQHFSAWNKRHVDVGPLKSLAARLSKKHLPHWTKPEWLMTWWKKSLWFSVEETRAMLLSVVSKQNSFFLLISLLNKRQTIL